jgi:Na+/H+ antiporter NhaD/arsenite permease-like protein
VDQYHRILVFIAGYLAIALEHILRVNKAAAALITGVLCWTLFFLNSPTPDTASEQLIGHLGEIASILFFLLGAMTIVELIDVHHGFDLITRKITTTSKRRLLLIVTVLTFFLSALLDNLTTAIVMTSLCIKLLPDRKDRLWFSGIIIIASNSGGAWNPLGDVTTTMLWIGGQVTALQIMYKLFFPAIVVSLLPALLLARRYKGKILVPVVLPNRSHIEQRKGKQVLFSGVGFLLFVPMFKTITHLPPFMGMLLALGMMWIITTLMHKNRAEETLERFSVNSALQKIDTPSILFFLGILLAVTALQSMGILAGLAAYLNTGLKNDYLIGISLGLLSSVVDNVPLVAAAQGMYDLQAYPPDHNFWSSLALTTGTGGSPIIIGSAAGVAVMGIERINFMWYLKKISWLALIGFAGGIFALLLQLSLTA